MYTKCKNKPVISFKKLLYPSNRSNLTFKSYTILSGTLSRLWGLFDIWLKVLYEAHQESVFQSHLSGQDVFTQTKPDLYVISG